MNKRRANLTSPLTRAYKRLLALVLQPFGQLPPRTQAIIGCAVLVSVTTLLLARPAQQALTENYLTDDVVRRTVIAPADLNVLDQAETSRRQKAAYDNHPPVFTFDQQVAEKATKNFREAWLKLKEQKEQNKKPEWQTEGGSKALLNAIAAHNFSPDDLDRAQRIMDEIAERHIYDEADAEHLTQEVVLIDLRSARAQTTVSMPQTRFLSRQLVPEKLSERLTQLDGWTGDQQNALANTMATLIQANVRYSPEATQQAREKAMREVKPVSLSLKRNQVVAREGDTVTPAMLPQFQAIQTYSQSRRIVHHIFGLLFLVSGLYWLVWQYIKRRAAAVALPVSPKKAFALVGLSIMVQTLLVRVGFVLADSINVGFYAARPGEDYSQWSLAIPFAAGALLVALLVDTQLGFITGLMTALAAAMLAPRGGALALGLYALLSSAVAIYGIKRYRDRQSVTLAGLLAGVINGLTAVALIAYSQQPIVFNTSMMAFGCGVLGGLLTMIFTAGGLPINEALFNILTDVRLLELSNADLPILSQLAMHAPGTNQHSHAVGQLTEEACRAIGANPLLARIGALYHDIGKMGSPLHFIENQNGANPHDKLKPLSSAKIIANHVTFGLKLAQDIGLPQQIADFIPQHHGTRILHYFHRRALDQAKPGDVVNEEDYRYPGPKPQFKEAAIMMIADSCEAAARSLAQPTPECISAIVGKIIKAIQDDGQLDECPLTLREITLIRASIVHSLVAIYHTRVTYPGFNPPDNNSLAQLPAAELDAEERGLEQPKLALLAHKAVVR